MSTDDLVNKKCKPCTSGTEPLKGDKLVEYLKMLGSGWKVVDDHHLEKEYTFPNFRQALVFTNLIGDVAEKEGHHPDIHLSWGKVKVILYTHKINGLSESDFILSAKCDFEFPKVEAQVCF